MSVQCSAVQSSAMIMHAPMISSVISQWEEWMWSGYWMHTMLRKEGDWFIFTKAKIVRDVSKSFIMHNGVVRRTGCMIIRQRDRVEKSTVRQNINKIWQKLETWQFTYLNSRLGQVNLRCNFFSHKDVRISRFGEHFFQQIKLVLSECCSFSSLLTWVSFRKEKGDALN